MGVEGSLLVLLAVATGIALFARLLGVPYAIALVAAGLGLGELPFLHPPRLTMEFLYDVILPGLIFEAAFDLEYRDFRANRLAILGLSFPGVVAGILLTGAATAAVLGGAGLVPGFSTLDGLVLAAILAATDPIAVVAVFRTLGAPRRLATLVEGESLLNDGTGMVLFALLVALATGRQSGVVGLALRFVYVVGGGAAIGLLAGYLIAKAIQRIDDAVLEITLTTVAAYAPFLVAEHLGLSGVIATVASGMLCRNYAYETGMSAATRLAVGSFWEYLAFVLNSIVFLLIGVEVHPAALLGHWRVILVVYAAMLGARAIVVFGAALLLRPTRERMPASWAAVVTWAGLRGALAMVLPFGLPADYPHRDVLFAATIGAVALSLFVQGLTAAPLARRLGLCRPPALPDVEARARLRAALAALAEIEELGRRGELQGEALAALRRQHAEAVAAAGAAQP